MNTFVPSVIYTSSAYTVGEDVTSFSSVPSFSGTSASLGQPMGQSMSVTSPAATGFNWSDLGKGLLNLGTTVGTGFANLSLQKAQLKAQAQANRPVVMTSPTFNPVAFQSAPASSSGGISQTTLLYAGGALALGLIAFAALRRK